MLLMDCDWKICCSSLKLQAATVQCEITLNIILPFKNYYFFGVKVKGSYWVGENNGIIRRDRAP